MIFDIFYKFAIEINMVVGIYKLTLIVHDSNSLKEKRQVLRKIKDQLKKTNVSIAEVDAQDLWQKAVLGLALVGTDKIFVESSLQKIVNFIDNLHLAELVKEEKDFFHF